MEVLGDHRLKVWHHHSNYAARLHNSETLSEKDLRLGVVQMFKKVRAVDDITVVGRKREGGSQIMTQNIRAPWGSRLRFINKPKGRS